MEVPLWMLWEKLMVSAFHASVYIERPADLEKQLTTLHLYKILQISNTSRYSDLTLKLRSVLWDVTLCSLINRYQNSRETAAFTG